RSSNVLDQVWSAIMDPRKSWKPLQRRQHAWLDSTALCVRTSHSNVNGIRGQAHCRQWKLRTRTRNAEGERRKTEVEPRITRVKRIFGTKNRMERLGRGGAEEGARRTEDRGQ